MEYWTNKNIKIPKLGFGTWMLEKEEAISSVKKALEVGYRHIDTASIYSNETEVGIALKESSIPRENIFLTTKIWKDYLDPEQIKQQAQTSLDKLKTDYVDLLLIHWPNSKFPLEATLKAFEDLVKEKKTLFIGVSNFPSELLSKAKSICPSLITNQVEYHPFLSQKKLLKVIEDKEIFLTAYSSLARGEILKSQQMQHIAKKYNKTEAQITLRWLVEQKNVVPLVKSKDANRIKENFNIFDFELEKEDQNKIYRLTNQKRRIVNPPFSPSWDE